MRLAKPKPVERIRTLIIGETRTHAMRWRIENGIVGSNCLGVGLESTAKLIMNLQGWKGSGRIVLLCEIPASLRRAIEYCQALNARMDGKITVESWDT